jgi:hypothetical protein
MNKEPDMTDLALIATALLSAAVAGQHMGIL